MTASTQYLAKTLYGVPIANAVFDSQAQALRWALERGVEFPGHRLVEVTITTTERVIRRDRRAA